MKKVLVMGAGVVGVTSAYYLARAGFDVTVVDRQPAAAMETSFANGGQISASHAEPWAGPDTPRNLLKWFGRFDAPLLVRMRWDPALWRWGLRFLRNCTAARVAVNLERALRIAIYSRQCLSELRATTGIEYDQRCEGILHVYRDPRAYRSALAHAEAMSRLGLERHPVDVAGCTSIEPALTAVADKLHGGIYSPEDESGDAHRFTQSLAEVCRGLGVVFRFQATLRQPRLRGGRLISVSTDTDDLTADYFVLSLGSYSQLFAQKLGLRLPIYPAKGYSVTLPTSEQHDAPHVSITDDEHKLVFSRLGQRLRVAGMAEFSGYDTSLDARRCTVLQNRVAELFPSAGDADHAEFWTGLRPKTPDSVPIIGASPIDNLFLNTGHGTLGWTMSCGSARLLADLVRRERPEISPQGLGLDRFA